MADRLHARSWLLFASSSFTSFSLLRFVSFSLCLKVYILSFLFSPSLSNLSFYLSTSPHPSLPPLSNTSVCMASCLHTLRDFFCLPFLHLFFSLLKSPYHFFPVLLSLSLIYLSIFLPLLIPFSPSLSNTSVCMADCMPIRCCVPTARGSLRSTHRISSAIFTIFFSFPPSLCLKGQRITTM